MKKSILSLLCVGALCVGLLAGCGKTEENGSPSDVEPSTSPVVSQEPDDSVIPEPVKTEETKDVEVTIEGQTETVSMNVYEVVINGKELKMCIDDANYNAYYFEGELEIAPKTDAGVEPAAKLHLYYQSGKTADIAAQEALTQFAGATDEGTVKIGDFEAYCVTSKTEDNFFTVYYIPFGEDTIAVSAYSTNEATEGHLVRMLAMVATITAK